MQMQKQVEYAGNFTNYHEVEFDFKKLDEELREHESYDGVNNYVKYFIKVQMNYQGGSMIAGNDLEVLHEFTVRNYLNQVKPANQARLPSQLDKVIEEVKGEEAQVTNLDATFTSDVGLTEPLSAHEPKPSADPEPLNQ